ncbi:DUF2877 domain-containing protein [Nocardioides sp.]|uniref:DUF2877 domain-containing protein n=1 Tax=Nocardioides sp. TaxID=35761 RepID=UPI002ED098A8
MIPVAAPRRVRERLHAVPDGPVPILHRSPQAIYVDVGGWCVGVLAPRAAQVPCGLRATGVADLDDVVSGDPAAYVSCGTLHVGSCALPVGRIVETYVPRVRREVVLKKATPVTVQATPPATVAGFAASHLADRRIDAATADDLLGRGEGLTPLGDDVLAGWLALHRAAGVPTPDVEEVVRGATERTTLLSATLLDCAQHGEVLPEYAAWLRALGTDEEPARVRALHAVGATSGAGLHLGATVALDSLREAA